MTCLPPKDIAVVIPARNEAKRIETCLMALADQWPDRTTVILVVNNTSDATGEIARRAAARQRLDLEILDCVLPVDQGVGLARRMGCDHALRLMPNLKFLLTTDADCIVCPEWIAGNVNYLRSADAICGKIELIPAEANVLDAMNPVLATNEGIYRRLVQDVYARHSEGCADIAGTHGEAAGASLAFRKAAYLGVGGFRPVKCGEDRSIVRALRMAGHRVRHVEDVVVYASCRMEGRAENGMSDALKLRISGSDYLVDDCLPLASRVKADARLGTLGVWPPLVAEADRVHVSDLPQNIELLKVFMKSRPTTPPQFALAAPVEAAPLSLGNLLPSGKGSADESVDPNPWPPSMSSILASDYLMTPSKTSAEADNKRSVK